MWNRIGNLPWEAQALIGILFGLLLLPLLTGWLLLRLYRQFRPLESEEDEIGLVTQVHGPEDGFFKKLLVGWVLWAPILWWLYQNHLA